MPRSTSWTGCRRVSSGVGEITFDDGTKLAISSSARLTIDASVAPGSSRFKKLGLKAVGGSFRWVSGKSPSSAYKIQTPTASMAIRGTAFDVTIRGGKTYVILLNGSARLWRRIALSASGFVV